MISEVSQRRARKARRRKLLIGSTFFIIVASCFASLFGLGNRAAVWVVGLYVLGMLVFGLSEAKTAIRGYRSWLSHQNFQPRQADGFSPLEVAALQNLLVAAGSDAVELARYLASSEVVERYNSGTGLVVTLQSTEPFVASCNVARLFGWFVISAEKVVIGARLWADDREGVALLEFFTGGHITRHWEWTHEPFGDATDECTRPPVPLSSPVVSAPSVKYFPRDQL